MLVFQAGGSTIDLVRVHLQNSLEHFFPRAEIDRQGRTQKTRREAVKYSPGIRVSHLRDRGDCSLMSDVTLDHFHAEILEYGFCEN